MCHATTLANCNKKSHVVFGALLSAISEHGQQHRGVSTAEQQSTGAAEHNTEQQSTEGGHWSAEDSSSKLSFKAPTLQAS